MKALAQLGLKVNGEIPLDILLSENFNGSLYGMTQEESAKVRALRQVVTQYNKAHSSDKSQPVTDSQKAADLVYGMLRDLAHEEVWVAYMTACNTVISVEMIFKGSLDAVNISHRDIIAKALSKNATNIIVFHNHPSGCPTPGKSDIDQTRLLQKACKMMEIGMLDHIIVSPGCYFSFADECTTKFKTK